MAKRKADKTGRYGRQVNVFDEDAISEAESAVSAPRKGEGANAKQTGAAGQFLSSLRTIDSSLRKANPYFVICLKPNDRRIANQFDSKCVRTQVQALGIAEISKRLRVADFSIFLPFAEFLGLAENDTAVVGSEKERAEAVLDSKPWRENEVRVGATGVFLSERCWLEIANDMDIAAVPRGTSMSDDNLLNPNRAQFGDSRAGLLSPSPGAFYHDDKGGSYFGSKDVDARSEAPSGVTSGDMFHGLETPKAMGEKIPEKELQEIDVVQVSGSRKRWLFIVYALTFYIPDVFIKWMGRIKRKDVRLAWREKLAINLLIWLSCGFLIFLMSKCYTFNLLVYN
jgi:chitin synthase